MTKRQQYLNSMGIEVWQNRNIKGNAEPLQAVTSVNMPAIDWDALHNKVINCNACSLCKTRTNVVFGVGNRKAEVMFVGEAPGENEDLKGEPFVGRAGMLLNEMIRSIGLERKKVYIANILKCRPPKNRDPLPSEVDSCTPYLQEQISCINPKVIIAVGRIAAHFLLHTDESMGRLRGRKYNYGLLQTPLFIIYHPAYLLRSPREKSKAYADLKYIASML